LPSFAKSQNTGLYPEIPDAIVAAAGANTPCQGHAAREKNQDPLLDRDVGIRGAVARADGWAG